MYIDDGGEGRSLKLGLRSPVHQVAMYPVNLIECREPAIRSFPNCAVHSRASAFHRATEL